MNQTCQSVIGIGARSILARKATWTIPLGIGRGLRIGVDTREPLHLYAGTIEFELTRAIRALATPGSCCFDIGGHNGYYALALARLTSSDVVTFEYEPDAVAQMRRNLSLNPGLAKRITIIQKYVAHETVVDPPADTLDHLIETGQIPEPDFVKIDVEGAEALVLGGAYRLLSGGRPHLIIETHSQELESECASFLLGIGYAPRIVEQRRRLREHRGASHNRWLVAVGRNSAAPNGRNSRIAHHVGI